MRYLIDDAFNLEYRQEAFPFRVKLPKILDRIHVAVYFPSFLINVNVCDRQHDLIVREKCMSSNCRNN